MSSGIRDLRMSDGDGKNRRRAQMKLLHIPQCKDRERRELLESDDVEWLRWYFGPQCGLGDPFTYEFTAQQLDMIKAIGRALSTGSDQSIAASRGEGKTTIAERLALKYTLTGASDYTFLLAATGSAAEDILDSLSTYLNDNVLLIADYPEVCVPVGELQGAVQKARTQLASGVRFDNGEPYEMAELNYSWCGNEFIFPRVPGSPSAGAIIGTRGLDAAIRGVKKRGKRPKLAIVDDPDTEDTARSEDQAAKLEKRVDAAIGGLGGQRRSVGRVILTTLQSRIAVSYKLTDPKQKPTFKGRRYRFLVIPPTRLDLWDEYIQLRLADLQRRDANGTDLDPEARRSHQFYLANREAMDAGAIVSNPNRYDPAILEDGTQREVSALQHYYNLVAKLGQEVVATEYDNDPPEEMAVSDSGLSATRIQRQVSGYPRQHLPDGTSLVTAGADVRKTAIHWGVRAWVTGNEGLIAGHTIDYGVHEVRGTKYGSDEGVDEAIRRAILELVESLREQPYRREDGEVSPIDLMLIDAHWKKDAVFAACHEAGAGVMPVMGFGRSSGCAGVNFSEQQRRTPDRKPGDGWFLSRPAKTWIAIADADRWKAWEHDRWLTAPDKPGAFLLFGTGSDANSLRMTDDEKGHHSYARHITNEREVEEVVKGVLKRRWKARSENTHWLDASYYASVAASIKGVRMAHAAPTRARESSLISTPAAPAAAVVDPQQGNRRTRIVTAPAQGWFTQQVRRR